MLLVEADLRRPRINKLFHLQQTSGLADVLAEKNHSGFVQCWLDCNMYPDIARVNVLPAGAETAIPSQLLGSRRMDDLLRKWRGEFDFIVIDTPPVLVFTDAAILSRHADAVLFVVRSGKPPCRLPSAPENCLSASTCVSTACSSTAQTSIHPISRITSAIPHASSGSYYHAVRGRSA